MDEQTEFALIVMCWCAAALLMGAAFRMAWNWQWAWLCTSCNRVKGYVPFGELWYVETDLCSTCGQCAADVAKLVKVRWRFGWQVKEQP
jgi:hypothetical protein